MDYSPDDSPDDSPNLAESPPSEENFEAEAPLIPPPLEVEPDIQERVEPVQTEPAPPIRQSPPYLLAFVLAITFIVGLAIGFLGRPVLIKDLPIEVVVTVMPNPQSQAVAQAPQPDSAQTNPQSSSDQPQTDPVEAEAEAEAESESESASAMPTPTIMDFVLSDARHIQGEASAPITVVEFSDFK